MVGDVVSWREKKGDIAQLARVLAWHARGRGFDSPYLHKEGKSKCKGEAHLPFTFIICHFAFL